MTLKTSKTKKKITYLILLSILIPKTSCLTHMRRVGSSKKNSQITITKQYVLFVYLPCQCCHELTK